jgi:hypothetical protein
MAACGDEGGIGGDRKAFIDALTPACENAVQEADRIGDATDTATLEQDKNVWAELYQEAKARPIPSEDFDGGQKFVVGLFNISAASDDAYQSSLIGDNAAMQRALNTEDLAKKSTSETASEYGFESGCNELDTGGEDDSEDD